MSRSYRKTPVITEQSRRPKRARWSKRHANKKVRRYGMLSGKGRRYRRVWDPWNICDWRAKLWRVIISKYFDGDEEKYFRK